MLKFNELRITPNGSHLIVDASVDNMDYYKDIIIDSIIIDTQDTYTQNGPSSKPVYVFNTNKDNMRNVYTTPEECNCNPVQEDEDIQYCYVEDEYTNKNVRLLLSAEDIGVSLSDNMLFVYVIATGIPASDTPCGLDEGQIMGTVINLYPIYQSSMCYMSELNSDCEMPKGLIDNIIRIKAIELCVKTGNYTEAIKHWRKFNVRNNNKVTYNKCRCYGPNN